MTLLALILGMIAGGVVGYVLALPSGHISRFHRIHQWKPWVITPTGQTRSCKVCNITEIR